MAQDQIQALKLEISKQTKLTPYERISFHKILKILKTENGMKVLLNELKNEPLIRESAILAVSDFDNEEVKAAFLPLLREKVSDKEKIYILAYLEKHAGPEDREEIIHLVDLMKGDPESYPVLSRAFNVLRTISTDSEEVADYLKSIAASEEYDIQLRSYAVVALAHSSNIITSSGSEEKSFFEDLLRSESEEIIYSVYKAIYILSNSLQEKSEKNKSDDDQIFTFTPDQEDKSVLDIRVILGKMTSQFDSYSNAVKVSFINAMISCNHREFLIYTMKALTSGDPVLVDMTLNLLLSEAQKLRDPDKLFRNLIALSIDSPKGSDIIVDIFDKFFSNLPEIRRNLILKDKLYNYLVVTLESYFETFRKDFMIKEVIEKDFPEDFQRIRQFILIKCNPDFKNKIVNYLRQADTSVLPDLLKDLSERIPYVDEENKEDINLLIDILFDKDEKSREISASRLEDINFEKRYLKERIIRLCMIIGVLRIETAASQLVIIYNYLKKYPDVEILDNVSSTLSLLNYSYMVGELEVLLATGDEEEQEKAIQFLSLFSDQRSLNILLDCISQNIEGKYELVITLLETLLKQEIAGNVSANQILKILVETHNITEVKSLAIQCLGKCGEEKDIAYLYDIFFLQKETPPKEAIVQAIGHIININPNVNKLPIIRQLKEYLKDSGIRVRIYSCFLLIQLGDKNAIKVITDMMTIKNKSIQRDIISILGNLRSVEFAYFLLSLLTDEYAIASDILPVIKLLPGEELLEIDHFITNIFKKHEFVELDESPGPRIEVTSKPIKGLIENESVLLNVQILNFRKTVEQLSITELTMLYKDINNIITSEIIKNQGIISRITNGRVVSIFNDASVVSDTALAINKNIKIFNRTRLPKNRMNVSINILTDNVKIINEEIFSLAEDKVELIHILPIINRILIDNETRDKLEGSYTSEPITEVIFKQSSSSIQFHELISAWNFLQITEEVLERLEKDEEEKLQRELDLEEDIKKQKERSKSSVTIAYAQALDDITRILKKDLNEVNKYVQMRTTDRVLISNVDKMLTTIYKRFFVEKSKIFSELE